MFLVAIIQIIKLTIQYRKWRKFAVPSVGVVGELKDITCNYNRKGEISSYRHHYVLNIVHNNTTFSDIYTEDVKPDDEPLTYPGKKINILWSINEYQYLDVDRTKDGIREGSKYACISCGIFGILTLPIIVAFIIDMFC